MVGVDVLGILFLLFVRQNLNRLAFEAQKSVNPECHEKSFILYTEGQRISAGGGGREANVAT